MCRWLNTSADTVDMVASCLLDSLDGLCFAFLFPPLAEADSDREFAGEETCLLLRFRDR